MNLISFVDVATILGNMFNIFFDKILTLQIAGTTLLSVLSVTVTMVLVIGFYRKVAK